jgi:UDP-N-acetylenolpyruvoylglucosamine reductase
MKYKDIVKKHGKTIENIDLKEYTTYKVGGVAKLLVYPKNEKKLIELIKKLYENNIRFKILGNGSNLIFSDDGFDGVLIKLDEFDNLEINKNTVKVGAGYNLMKLSLKAVKLGLAGLEFAAGIPGTVGGAVFMNAGCYGSDIGYVLKEAKILTPDLKVVTMKNRELNFHYRTSFLKENEGYICLGATFLLRKYNKDELLEIINDRKQRRIKEQPLEYPTAGSVFRNPKGMFSAKIIEDLGYKGMKVGGAEVSKKHANFIVNNGNATAKDIEKLINKIKKDVKNKHNIELKEEQEFVK